MEEEDFEDNEELSHKGQCQVRLSFSFIFGGNVSARCFHKSLREAFNISLREVSCVSES